MWGKVGLGSISHRLMIAGAFLLILGLVFRWYSIEIGELVASGSTGFRPTLAARLMLLAVISLTFSLSNKHIKKTYSALVSSVAAAYLVLTILGNWPERVLGDVSSIGVGYWMALLGSTLVFAGSVWRLLIKHPSK